MQRKDVSTIPSVRTLRTVIILCLRLNSPGTIALPEGACRRGDGSFRLLTPKRTEVNFPFLRLHSRRATKSVLRRPFRLLFQSPNRGSDILQACFSQLVDKCP